MERIDVAFSVQDHEINGSVAGLKDWNFESSSQFVKENFNTNVLGWQTRHIGPITDNQNAVYGAVHLFVDLLINIVDGLNQQDEVAARQFCEAFNNINENKKCTLTIDKDENNNIALYKETGNKKSLVMKAIY